MKEKLTLKQKRFCDEYMKSGNATQSYKDAGYSVKKDITARVNAHKLLTNNNVKEYLEKCNKKIDRKSIADIIEIKEFWTCGMRNEDNDMKDRIKCSELHAKSNGAFLDKVEHSGDMNIKHAGKIDFSGLTTDELRRLTQIGKGSGNCKASNGGDDPTSKG